MKSVLIILFVVLGITAVGYGIKENGLRYQPTDMTPMEFKDVTPTTHGVVNLNGQGLTKVPSYIFDRTDIEELNLSNNALDGSLQAEVRHLQNLRVLNLSNNKFTGVPAEVGQLKNLEILDLSNNKLTGLPYELGNLSKLKLLDISGNAYAEADLAKIRASLPSSTVIKTQ